MGTLPVAVIAARGAGWRAPVIPAPVAPLLAAGGALGLLVRFAAAMVGAGRSCGGGSALAGTKVGSTAGPGVQR
jgi:hypothetical protein